MVTESLNLHFKLLLSHGQMVNQFQIDSAVFSEIPELTLHLINLTTLPAGFIFFHGQLLIGPLLVCAELSQLLLTLFYSFTIFDYLSVTLLHQIFPGRKPRLDIGNSRFRSFDLFCDISFLIFNILMFKLVIIVSVLCNLGIVLQSLKCALQSFLSL